MCTGLAETDLNGLRTIGGGDPGLWRRKEEGERGRLLLAALLALLVTLVTDSFLLLPLGSFLQLSAAMAPPPFLSKWFLTSWKAPATEPW